MRQMKLIGILIVALVACCSLVACSVDESNVPIETEVFAMGKRGK